MATLLGVMFFGLNYVCVYWAERYVTSGLVAVVFALLAAHEKRPGVFHAAIASPPGWAAFARFCRGDMSFASAMRYAPMRAAVKLASR